MSFTEVSLSVLYLLQEAHVSLNMEQISEGLEKAGGFTYLDAAPAVLDLTEKGFLREEDSPMGTLYSLTVEGRVNLSHLIGEIRASVRRELSAYAQKKAADFTLSARVYARAFPTASGYQVVLRAFDKDMAMSDVTLTVSDETEAKQIMENWTRHADEAVAALYGVLIRDTEPR